MVQIILEIESESHRLLPRSVPRRLIQVYGDHMGPIILRYLERPMDSFCNHQGDAQDTPEASLNHILNGATNSKNDHLGLIRTELD